MKAQSFEYHLRHAVPPAPDTEAQLRARRTALAEFARAHAQNDASDTAAQPAAAKPARKSESLWPLGWTRQGAWLGGFATACVLLVGVSVVWLMPPKDREIRFNLPPTPQQPTTQPPLKAELPPVAQPPANEQPMQTEASREPPIAPAIRPRAEHRKKTPSLVLPAQPPGAVAPTIEAPIPSTTEAPFPTDRPAPAEVAESPAAAAGNVVEDHSELTISGSRIQPRDQVANSAIAVMPAERDSHLEEIVVTEARRQRGFFSRKASVPTPPPPAGAYAEEGRDKFQHFEANPVKRVADDPISTFSADVDTSAYSFVRRKLNEGVLPQVDAVRVEEMINYFDYAWPAADSREQPFRPTVAVSDSPWGRGKKLIHIGIKGYALPASQRPEVNLVLLLDVSGSMDSPDKLPLAQRSMALLLDSLRPTDTVAIVVYAGAAGQVLAPTPVSEKETILHALYSLQPGGSTAGAAGIQLAYALAEKSFRKGGVNRILLATDGDFNVGITDQNELKGFVAREREKGVYLSVLGFGEGNYRDEMAQTLAQNGNGVAAYIDTLNEAKKVLVQEATSSLFPIAKDVKLQVEFNPATVAEYRLVGYETRALNREDFNNDKVDAGDVGSGHTVTAIYEITPVGSDAKLIDDRRYAAREEKSAARGKGNEYGFLRIRYKLPNGFRSRLLEQPILVDAGVPATLREDVKFSTAVAGFGQLLRGSPYIGSLSFEDVIQQAQGGVGADPFGYRAEFVQLVSKAERARGL